MISSWEAASFYRFVCSTLSGRHCKVYSTPDLRKLSDCWGVARRIGVEKFRIDIESLLFIHDNFEPPLALARTILHEAGHVRYHLQDAAVLPDLPPDKSVNGRLHNKADYPENWHAFIDSENERLHDEYQLHENKADQFAENLVLFSFEKMDEQPTNLSVLSFLLDCAIDGDTDLQKILETNEVTNG